MEINSKARMFEQLPCALKHEILSDLANGNFEIAKQKYDAWKLKKSVGSTEFNEVSG